MENKTLIEAHRELYEKYVELLNEICVALKLDKAVDWLNNKLNKIVKTK